ncbi:MAG: PKD domain-containing protein [Candidatus Bipolaricaulota bacterium]
MKRILALLVLLLPLALSGCVLDTILDDMVNREPRAVIDARPTSGPAPLEVQLDAHYSHDDDGNIVEYRWDLGDPTKTGSRPESALTHQFGHPGTYLVKLTVIDNEGALSSQQVAVVVTNAPPVAVASVNDREPFPGDEVTFDASGSYDPYGAIQSYAWDFADGTTGVGRTVTHTYSKGGPYLATLTVTDDEGATASAQIGLNVMPGETNCSGNTCSGGAPQPLAVITGLPNCSGGKVGVPVRLDGTASRAGTGEIVHYHWDFGDETTASGPIVEHTYTRAWSYTVVLTVTDSAGNTGIARGNCSIGGSTCTSL